MTEAELKQIAHRVMQKIDFTNLKPGYMSAAIREVAKEICMDPLDLQDLLFPQEE